MRNKNLWRKTALAFVQRELGIDGIWDAEDPYELREVAEVAFRRGDTPENFIREVFAEDFDRKIYEQSLEDEAAQSMDEENAYYDEDGELVYDT